MGVSRNPSGKMMVVRSDEAKERGGGQVGGVTAYLADTSASSWVFVQVELGVNEINITIAQHQYEHAYPHTIASVLTKIVFLHASPYHTSQTWTSHHALHFRP